MEFDKSKILTVVTADQAKIGMKGWFGNNMLELEDQVKNVPSSKLTTLCYGFMKAFEKDKGLVHYLFYPAPEPTYRPFKNAEEFKPYRDEWFKHKESKCYDMYSSVTDYSDRGIVLCDPYSEKDSLKFRFYTWGGFFEEFECENGDPCGIREEV